VNQATQLLLLLAIAGAVGGTGWLLTGGRRGAQPPEAGRATPAADPVRRWPSPVAPAAPVTPVPRADVTPRGDRPVAADAARQRRNPSAAGRIARRGGVRSPGARPALDPRAAGGPVRYR
jgi:hypothetical protein